MFRRTLLPWLALAAFAASGCASHGAARPSATTDTGATAAPTALPEVAEPAASPNAPAWFAELSPRGEAAVGAQIRIRFVQDVVPVETLEAPDRQAALAKFEIAPAIPGRFVFVTPRMVTFAAERRVPKASRFVVTIRAGLSDRKGHVLNHDVSYSFRTEPLDVSVVRSNDDAPQGARPRVVVAANVALDEASLAARATLEAPGASPIPLAIARDATPSPGPKATPEGSASFDDEPAGRYVLVPQRDVPLGTTYGVRIAAGVRPAAGNVATADGQTGSLRTYGPLAFGGLVLDLSDPSRPLTSGDPQLVFDNGIDAKSASAAIAIEPAARSGYTLLAPSTGSTTIALNPAALQPHTRYTVTIAASLADVFGQRLGHAVTANLTTGALAPELWAPSGFSIFPATANVALDVATASLPGNRYRAKFVNVTPADLVRHDTNQFGDVQALLGDATTWPSRPAPAASDVESTSAVPLEKTYGGPTGLLAYGVAADYALEGQPGQHQQIAGAVQVTNVGVFAQWFPTGGFVRAHHLSDGSPIAGASVEIYESKPAAARSEDRPCATGRTDGNGTLDLSTERFARCLSVAGADQAPALLAIVRSGNDWSFVRTEVYGQSLGDAGFAAWSAGTPHPRGSFISDRNLYQRGETAYFTGLGYFERAGEIVAGSSRAYDVTIRSPHGKIKSLGSHAPDEFGAFATQTTIDSAADLGDWTIVATGEHGETFSSPFTVAQFKAPNFKVALALDAPVAIPGETVRATTTSTYLFGAPVEGGSEHVSVTRSRSAFVPKGYETYSFGPLYLDPEQAPDLASDVTQADLKTSADGTTTLPIVVAADLPYAADYRVDGETTDVSNLAVSDSRTFTALPSRNLIALRGDFVGEAQTSYPFDFAVVDPTGAPVAGRNVHFVLSRRVYDDATQLVEGSATDRPAVHYETVAEFDATSASAVQHLKTTPAKAGEYRLRANFNGATGEATATDLELFVAGDGADWYRPGDTSLAVKLDKPSYRPGETATALIASPYADAELFFAIVRNKTITRRILHVHGSGVRVPFVVTSDMLPNVAVEAALVRAGPSLASGVPAGLKDLSRVGFAGLHVALDSQYVTVSIAPELASVRPGQRQHVKFHVADKNGAPVEAELTVAVANDAILQLSGYRFPDLVTQIYADEPISTRYGDNRTDVKLASEHRFVEKGFGYGGGQMAGPAGTRVRTNFRPVAFFDGSVRTDAGGDATVDFALPDDLTTWRVLATAFTRDGRFGSSDGTFVATKPLVTNPILPQFARPGDTLEGGVSVTDVAASAPGSPSGIDLEGSLDGALSFADPAGRTVSQKGSFAGRTAGYRFAMLVKAASDARMTFRTTLAGATDALRVALPIVSDDTLESVVETGTTTGSASVPLSIDPALPSDLGGVSVTLASTLLGDTLAPLDAALRGDGLPFAFESASRIAIAADRIALERRYGHASAVPALLSTIAHQRRLLRENARVDGSYAFFPNGPGDPFTSAFVAVQLVRARSVGVDVAGDLAKLRGYLLAELADPSKNDANCLDRCILETRLEALETLAPIGDVRSDHLSEIYDGQESLSYYERVELARHLIRLPAWRDRGIALRDKLLEQLYETGRRAGLVETGDFGETPVDGQSQLLGLMIESGIAGDRVDHAFTSLLASRGRDGTWGCGCDDAEAMNAIVLYAARDTTPPDFVATANFAGGRFSQRFAGYRLTEATKTFPIASLPRGASQVALAKSGTGTLHYTVDFDYAVRGPSAGAYQGIRIDRIVRPAGEAGAVATFGLAAPSEAVSLDAARVFDIEDRITTDHPLEGLVVTDPLAAGLEAIDTRFLTNSAQAYEAVSDWSIDYQTIERSRVVTYAQSLQPGVYAFHYLVRSVTPGTYAWPPARAALALAPDEFGRTAGSTVTIK